MRLAFGHFKEMGQRHLQDRYDPTFVKRIRPVLGFFYEHYFRVGFHGIENVPNKPVLLVSNHNGILGAEVFMILEGWLRNFRRDRGSEKTGVLALAHEFILEHPVFRGWLPKLGAVKASHVAAHEAFDKGYSVLVYPGGDRDAFRSYRNRAKVDFDGREGFARLALDARVPIVPIVNVGGHEQAIVLWRADALAKRLGFSERYRMHGVPITLRGLPFVPGLFFRKTERAALMALFGASLAPLPAKMDFYFESPIQLSKEQESHLSRDEKIKTLASMTLKAIQSRLDLEYSKPRLPVWGPLHQAAK